MQSKFSDAPSLPPPPTPKRANHSPLIDIIEDDVDQALHLQNVLQKNGFRTRVFSEPTQFQTLFMEPNAEPPAAVIMDLLDDLLNRIKKDRDSS